MKIYKKKTDKALKTRFDMKTGKALDVKAADEVAMTLTETEVNNLKDLLNGDAEIEIVEDPTFVLTDEEVTLLKELLPMMKELLIPTEEEIEEVEEVVEDEVDDLEDEVEEVEDEEVKGEDATTTKTEPAKEVVKEEVVEEEPKATDNKEAQRVWVKKKIATKAGDEAKKIKPNAEMFKTRQVKANDAGETKIRSFNFHK